MSASSWWNTMTHWCLIWGTWTSSSRGHRWRDDLLTDCEIQRLRPTMTHWACSPYLSWLNHILNLHLLHGCQVFSINTTLDPPLQPSVRPSFSETYICIDLSNPPQHYCLPRCKPFTTLLCTTQRNPLLLYPHSKPIWANIKAYANTYVHNICQSAPRVLSSWFAILRFAK